MRLTSLKKRLGDILVDVGIITPEQLKEALDIQKRSGGKLGTILAQMGVINEEVMLAFLGKQCGVSYVSLAEYGDLETDIVRLIPESVIRRQSLIPLSREGNTVTVAMADPFNVFAVDDIKLMTGMDVQVVIASESEIKASIEKYFSRLSETEGILLAAPAQGSGSAGQDDELLNAFLTQSLKSKTSAVYLEPKQEAVRVRYRIDGYLCEKARISHAIMETLVRRMKTLAGLDAGEKLLPQEGRFKTRVSGEDIDLRCSFIPTIFGERAIISINAPCAFSIDLDQLGFEPEVLSMYKKDIELPRGLVLLAGPSHSGKTALLYSTLLHLNHPDRDILTIENPVEYVIPGITQTQLQPRAGLSVARSMHGFLRQHPDILMLSEISDHWTARFAVEAAMGGSIVFAALTSANGPEAVAQMKYLGIDPFALASSLVMVVNQRLMRTVCPQCKVSYEIPVSSLRNFISPELVRGGDNDRITLWRGTGCPLCNGTGYHGRTGVLEVHEVNDPLRAQIAGENDHVPAGSLPMHSTVALSEAAWRKVAAGISTAEEYMRLFKLSTL